MQVNWTFLGRKRFSAALAMVVVVTGMAITGIASADEPFRGPYTYPLTTRNNDCGPYSDGGAAGDMVDPINVVFIGSHADADNVARVYAENPLRAGNNGFTAGSKQYVLDPDQVNPQPGTTPTATCRVQDKQSALGFKNKHHYREFESRTRQGPSGTDYVTSSDAHRDSKAGGTDYCYINVRPGGVFVGRAANDVVPRYVPLKYRDASGKIKYRYLSGYDIAQREVLDAIPGAHLGYQMSPIQRTFKQCNPSNGRGIMVPWRGLVQFFRISRVHTGPIMG